MESSFPGLSVLLSPLPVLPVLPPSGSLSMTVFSLRLAPQTVHSSCLMPVASLVAALSITHWKLCAAPAVTLTLDQTALELTVGGTGKLTATGAEGITWTSSNAGVAAVGEDGTVTAVAAGTATISASAEGADPVTCTVTVKEAPKKDLVLRSIYQSEGTPLEQFAMWAGDPAVPMTVDGTDSPVQWSTEDSSIATINSDGEVTAVKSGKTMVVAVVDGQTLKCEILVYDR